MTSRDIELLYELYRALSGDQWTKADGWKQAALAARTGALASSQQAPLQMYGVDLASSHAHAANSYVEWQSSYGRTGGVDYTIQYAARALRLPFNNLTGGLPPSLGSLVHLQSVELFGNRLLGQLPDAIGRLINLETLSLHSCLLTGRLPSALGNCRNLRSLELQQNAFSGTIPASLARLSHLRYLNLRNNRLIGEIPYLLHIRKNIPHDHTNINSSNTAVSP